MTCCGPRVVASQSASHCCVARPVHSPNVSASSSEVPLLSLLSLLLSLLSLLSLSSASSSEDRTVLRPRPPLALL